MFQNFFLKGEAKVDPEFEELSSYVTKDDLPTSSNRQRVIFEMFCLKINFNYVLSGSLKKML